MFVVNGFVYNFQFPGKNWLFHWGTEPNYSGNAYANKIDEQSEHIHFVYFLPQIIEPVHENSQQCGMCD